MTIVQELYSIFDREQEKFLARRSSKGHVVLELSQNLALLREGLADNLPGHVIISSFEDDRYRKAIERGINLDTIRKQALARRTFDGIREFEKYRGWSTAKLIHNAYERIGTLRKLHANSANVGVRLQYFFKYLMLVMAHIEDRVLAPEPERQSR